MVFIGIIFYYLNIHSTITTRRDTAAVIYEEVTDLNGNKPRHQVAVSDTPIASY